MYPHLTRSNASGLWSCCIERLCFMKVSVPLCLTVRLINPIHHSLNEAMLRWRLALCAFWWTDSVVSQQRVRTKHGFLSALADLDLSVPRRFIGHQVHTGIQICTFIITVQLVVFVSLNTSCWNCSTVNLNILRCAAFYVLSLGFGLCYRWCLVNRLF